ncbi:MAG: 4Fe-4S dicluster domain-containing protein [Elusimicrobia bacterium]|jgi:ferredoxin|nr:4Fe-4S dicluster domain-containing protein [Elusimicrobiota bacterium]
MIKTLKENFGIAAATPDFIRIGKPSSANLNNNKPYSAISTGSIRSSLLETGVFTEQDFNDINIEGCDIITANFLCRAPFSGYNYYLAENYHNELIYALRFMAGVLRAGRSEVIVPFGQSEIGSVYSKKIQRLPNIFFKAVKDRYPLCNDKLFKKEIYNYKYKPGKKHSVCDGSILIFNPYKLLKIFYSVIAPEMSEYIDVAVVTEKNKYIISVSRKKSVLYLLKKTGVRSDGLIIRESLLNGTAVSDPSNEAIGETRTFFMLKESEINLGKCIGCAKCVRICPAGIKYTFSKNILENGKGLTEFNKSSGCIGCGLCGYFCPGFKS